jgi:hypothetical protein
MAYPSSRSFVLSFVTCDSIKLQNNLQSRKVPPFAVGSAALESKCGDGSNVRNPWPAEAD